MRVSRETRRCMARSGWGAGRGVLGTSRIYASRAQNFMGKKPTDEDNGEKVLVKNRRAPFDYHLEQRFEAGMVLMGSEVKSMRAGTVDITDAWASIERDGLYLKNLIVQPLPHAAYPHEPRRARKLLLHAKEIDQIRKSIDHDKKTLIP